MRRRRLLRLCGVGGSTLIAGAMAGCLGDDDDDDGDEDDPGDADTLDDDEVEDFPQDEMGQRVVSEVDGLEVLGWDSTTGEDRFIIDVAVENTGDETVELSRYGFRVILIDTAGQEHTTMAPEIEEVTLPPGEVAVKRLHRQLRDEAIPLEEIDAYELTLRCSALAEVAKYCDAEE